MLREMKALWVTGLIVLLLLVVGTCYVNAYTYDGKVDPEVVQRWEQVGAQPENATQMLAMKKNPETGEPNYVLARLINTGQNVVVVMQAYYVEEKLLIYVAEFEDEDVHYKEVKAGDDVYNIKGWQMNFTVGAGITAIMGWDEVKKYLDEFLVDYIKKLEGKLEASLLLAKWVGCDGCEELVHSSWATCPDCGTSVS